MRLDKYLKVSRLIKRRTVANEACDNARISVNGKPAKASYDVKVGDQIEIAFGARTPARGGSCRCRGSAQGRRLRHVQGNLSHTSRVLAVYLIIRQAEEDAT